MVPAGQGPAPRQAHEVSSAADATCSTAYEPHHLTDLSIEKPLSLSQLARRDRLNPTGISCDAVH